MNKYLFLLIMQLIASIPIAAQRIGIGNVAPVAKLDITGPGAAPAIPGATSNGILRIGVNPIEAIDIGKMVDSTFAAWIQSGYNGNIPDPLSLQPSGGNVGIGTINPSNRLSVAGNANITGKLGVGNMTPNAKLDIAGTIRIADGTQGEGKVLTSDANGLASWQSPPPPTEPAYAQSVTICCQSWMTKNMDVSTYRNGDPIPKVTSDAAWAALTTGAYCYYNNDSTTYAAVYGKMYNWYAINDPRGLAPDGWHIPTAFEFTTLSECLGGSTVGGGPLKEMGTIHWNAPNSGATNVTGFTAVGGGVRSSAGTFLNTGTEVAHWGATEFSATNAWYLSLVSFSQQLTVNNFAKKAGFYLRCIRD